jgi:chlorophyll synthase
MVVWTGCLWKSRKACRLDLVSIPISISLMHPFSLQSWSSHSLILFYHTRPVAYSLTGLGVAIVNDFKSMEGDRKFGLQSLPILLGVDRAKWTAAVIPDVVQLFIATYLYSIGESMTAALLLALVIPQVFFQSTLLFPDPFQNDLKYVTSTQPFVSLGVLATALCIGHHQWPM